jgi:hypothetical protein
MLLIGCFAAAPAHAQNLDAGKSPSQIFAGTCTACHKSPRGLLRTVPAGSLPGFLREHYTTSSGMASLLSTYLISNGAADTRYGGGQPRPDRAAKSEARSGGEPEQVDRHGRRISPPREVAEPPQPGKPDADRLSSQADPRHRGRNARRLERAGEGPDAAKPTEAQGAAQQANQHGRDGRKARHRPGKRGRPVIDEEPGMGAATPEAGKSDAAKSDDATSAPSKTDAAKTDAAKDQPGKTEPAQPEKPSSGSASDEGGKPAADKPSGEASSEAAKVEPPKQTGSSDAAVRRADPAPAVTPAPAAAPAASATAASGTPAASTAVPEHAAAPSAATPPPAAPAAAVATSAPPPAPAAPDGSPTPPISK